MPTWAQLWSSMPLIVHVVDQSFRRQSCSEAAFGDPSSSSIANPKELRLETARRSRRREFGITDMVINEESSSNMTPLPSIEGLRDFDFNS